MDYSNGLSMLNCGFYLNKLFTTEAQSSQSYLSFTQSGDPREIGFAFHRASADWIKKLSLRDDLFSLIVVSRSGKRKYFLRVLCASVVKFIFSVPDACPVGPADRTGVSLW